VTNLRVSQALCHLWQKQRPLLCLEETQLLGRHGGRLRAAGRNCECQED
jgi:hypothetical protein